MGTSVAPEQDELDKALSEIRGGKRDPLDEALAQIRTGGKSGDIVLPPGQGNADVAPPKKLGASRPLAPMPARPDVTRVGAEPVGLEEQLRNEHPTLLDATVQGVKGMVEHPIDTGIALAKAPFKGGEAVGEYVKGGHLNEGKGRAAAIGAAQTAAMLIGGPAEKIVEPIAARLVGEAAAPLIARTAVGAATGATFSPDRPAVGAIIGGAAGALSSRGKAAEKIAADRARFDQLAQEHPDWMGGSTPPGAPKQLGDGRPVKTATAKVAEAPAEPSAPDYTVDEPNAPPVAPVTSPLIEKKGVFGGGLEQHGQDFAAGKVPPPETSLTPPAPQIVAPEAPVVAAEPAEVATEAAPVAVPAKEAVPAVEKHDYASTQVNLPGKAAVGIKRLAATIPDEDLAENGREDNPHITVKYGLHGNPSKKLQALLADEPPVTVTLGKTSFFPNSESNSGDVLKVDVDSPDLHRLNKLIADALPHTDTHPEYQPHATIAYLKPGLGKKYEGSDALAGEEITLDHITLSGKDGKTIEIPLKGKASAAPDGKTTERRAAARPEPAELTPKDRADLRGKLVHERIRTNAYAHAEAEPAQRAIYKARSERIRKEIDAIDAVEMHRNLKEIRAKPPKKLGNVESSPVHESARTSSGRLRDNYKTVKTDGLISEMFKLLESERDRSRSIYRTVDDPNMSGVVTVPTLKGGHNLQAEALHRVELAQGAAKKIEAELNRRGLTGDDINWRWIELNEIESDRAKEREGLNQWTESRLDDASFDVESYTKADAGQPAKGTVQERANAPAKGAAGEGAGTDRLGEEGRSPESAPETEPERPSPKRLGLKGVSAPLPTARPTSDVPFTDAYRPLLEKLSDADLGAFVETLKARHDADPNNKLLHRDWLNAKNVQSARARELSPQTEFERNLLTRPLDEVKAELARHEEYLDVGLTSEDSRVAKRVVAIAKRRLAEATPSRQRLGLKGGISAREMAQRAKAGETREAVTAITGEEPTALSKDKKQSEMFTGEEAGQVPEDQSDLFSEETVHLSGTSGGRRRPRRGLSGAGTPSEPTRSRARLGPDAGETTTGKAAGRLDKAKDDIKRMFAPATRGPLAKETAHLTRATVGRMAHENEIAREALSGFAKAFDKMSREVRLEFIDRMESGGPQATSDLSDAADAIRDALDKSRDAIRSLGTGHLENYIENYFPHIWTNPAEAAKLVNSITGKRPLEGPRSFLKRRTIPTTKEGMTPWTDEQGVEHPGLEPISTNPVDLALLKLREMNRYLMGQRVMRGMKEEGLAKFVSAFDKAPQGYERINDHVAMVYGPPTIPVHEAFDAMVRDQLQKVIRSLKVEHDRPFRIPRLGADKWGAAYGSRKIDARFGGDATIIMHELGHILDHRYGLWDRLVEPIAKRTATKGKAKALGRKVADPTHPSNSPEAKKMRVKIKAELRGLADLRFEGKSPDLVGRAFRDYVREKPEQIANALHAYMYAKAKMQRIAPTVFSRLDEFIKADPALKPLSDIEPSVALGSGVTEAPVGGMVVKGQYWAPSEAATIINNYLSPGLRGRPIYDAYMAVGNSMNQFQLGFSAFHLGFTSMDAGVSQVALSLRELASGRPLRALGSFVTSPAAPVTTIRRGIKLRNAYLHPDQANAELTQLVSALVQGGGRVRMDDLYKTGAITGLRKAFHEHNPWGVAWRAFPAFAELAVKPVLEYVVPRQKLGVFYALMNLELAKLGPNPDPFRVRAVAARVWDSVDNRMGQLVYDNLFWNKTGKDLSMASVRAVGWNVGTWREIGGGLTDFTTAYKRHKAGDEAFTNRMAYVLALPLFVGMIGAIYNYLATGEPPKELEDYFYPRTGKNDPDGNPERVQLPSYMKDLWAYWHHPVRTIESKLHPTLEAIAEMLHNKDFYGTMIADPELSWKNPAEAKELAREYGKFMARAFSPFALRNAIEARRRNQSLATSGQSFIGITPAPREVVRTPAQNLMAEYLGRRAPSSRTPEEADKGQVHRQVIDAVRKGEMLPQSVTDMMRDKEGRPPRLSDELLNRWISEAWESPTVVRFKKLSFEQAKKVYERGTESEKAQWVDAYATKLDNAAK